MINNSLNNYEWYELELTYIDTNKEITHEETFTVRCYSYAISGNFLVVNKRSDDITTETDFYPLEGIVRMKVTDTGFSKAMSRVHSEMIKKA